MTLTTIRLLAPHLTPENHLDLLEKARHRSKRAVEELVAQLCPLPPVPAKIRRLPAPRHRPTARTAIEATHSGLTPCTESPEIPAGEDVPASEPQPLTSSAGSRTLATIAPLGAQRYRIQFTASAETHEKLRQAQALLRHQVPDGDVATIINRALTALLEQVAKQKVASADRPRQSGEATTPPQSRHIPNAVKREVWSRDGGRCAFVGRQGRRCSEDGFLEFHHVRPYAAGGAATPENIQLRCRAHNGYEAERYFGPRTLTGVKEGACDFHCHTEDTAGELLLSTPGTRPGTSSQSGAMVSTEFESDDDPTARLCSRLVNVIVPWSWGQGDGIAEQL